MKVSDCFGSPPIPRLFHEERRANGSPRSRQEIELGARMNETGRLNSAEVLLFVRAGGILG
jgi:hypothetical protein